MFFNSFTLYNFLTNLAGFPNQSSPAGTSIVTTLPIPSLVRKVIYGKGKGLSEDALTDFEVPDVVQDTDLL